MSGNSDDERIEELRQKKMQELQDQAEQQQGGGEAEEAARQQQEAQKDALLRKFLTDGARQRLNAVQMSKPDFAEQVERQVVALAQSGRIQGQIDEDQMKSILQELKPDSKSFNIRRR
ncbi:DNA-binding TFAR19-related protein [Halogranum rubrum]|uniref:DNA-binding protein SAMN04487950_0207 n=2 Tax=Halogranum rubrum TaxID=553466 RepID=A0A1I4AZA1_9EURY|nr:MULTISPECIES: DNA-binding protein [Halogranum]EJN58204.1 DNA-binding tfar19-related protein [Halogranum salarium B-1]SFK61908.1 DNA-binding TFAR19-related protein [Halogranum rubrum]